MSLEEELQELDSRNLVCPKCDYKGILFEAPFSLYLLACFTKVIAEPYPNAVVLRCSKCLETSTADELRNYNCQEGQEIIIKENE